MFENIKVHPNTYGYSNISTITLEDHGDIMEILFNPVSVLMLLNESKIDTTYGQFQILIKMNDIYFSLTEFLASCFIISKFEYNFGEWNCEDLYRIDNDGEILYLIDDYRLYVDNLLFEKIKYYEHQIEFQKSLLYPKKRVN